MSQAQSSPQGVRLPEPRFSDRRVLVTGAASGIGRASALRFAAEGARVLVADLDEGALKAVRREIEAAGGRAIALAGDAGREDDVRAWVSRCLGEWGGIDVAFANAGISGGWTPLLETTPELWQEILRVNLIGPLLLIREVVPSMREAGRGSIVVTSSVAGLRARAGSAPYSASKAGLISLVQTTSVELTGTGVRVNAVCPGLIETAMTEPIFAVARAKGREELLGSLVAAQRPGSPEDVAAAVLFLASDEAAYVTGQALPVDGGLSSTHPFRGPPPEKSSA